MANDELDKTLKDLQKVPPKKKKPSDTALIPESGGQLVWKEQVIEGPVSGLPGAELTVVDDYKAVMYANHVGVKDTYLPHVLVRLKLFKNNLESREYIRNVGVILNGTETHSCDATNFSENFVLKINGVEYQIFKMD